MLVKISIENFKSFDNATELTMISSNKIRTNASHRIKVKSTQILKYGVVSVSYTHLFVRFETGEGMEKKEENFAEEVAKQMGM